MKKLLTLVLALGFLTASPFVIANSPTTGSVDVNCNARWDDGRNSPTNPRIIARSETPEHGQELNNGER